jgi:urease accessory protein
MLGGLIALQVSLPTAVAIGLAAFFAIFHGYAHGAEVPADASGASYILGFITATGVLHLTGIGLGLAASKFLSSSVASRMAGGAIALAGAALVSGAL